jgi:pyruvate, orthophosphate dikinase
VIHVSVQTAYAWVANADPVTGEPAVLGELWHDGLEHGTRVPVPSVREADPKLYAELTRIARAAERPVRRLVRLTDGEVEFVAEEALGLTVNAHVRYLHARLIGGEMSEESYLHAFPADALAPVRSRIGSTEGLRLVARGVPASPGCGVGILWPHERAGPDGPFVVAIDRVEARHTALLRNPRCAGVISVRGSAADHFALLSREADTGYLTLPQGVVDASGLRVGAVVLPFGEPVTVDFSEGSVYVGVAELSSVEDDEARSSARSFLARMPRRVHLTISVDGPGVAAGTLPPGVDGIGIVRVEHMVRLAGLEAGLRQLLGPGGSEPTVFAAFVAALAEPLESMLRLAGGLPVAVRLLDLPVQELPGSPGLATDPTLGLRGVRQAVRWPHACRAQLGALVEAAQAVRATGGSVAPLRVLVPMVCSAAEVRLVRSWADAEREKVLVGAMLETPAALVEADTIAEECGFALFGTNDLTSLCLALGRTDYPSVLEGHLDRNLLAADPFEYLHPALLRLVRDAATRARATRPGIELGLCGRHARDPAVIDLALAGTLDHLCVERGDVDVVTLRALQRADS